jgi:hypothetical protein
VAKDILSIVPDESEIDTFRAHAREQRRQAHFALLEAEAAIAEWSADEVDPNNMALTAERAQFIAAHTQRRANLTEKWAFWDARVKQYAAAQGKSPAKAPSA